MGVMDMFEPAMVLGVSGIYVSYLLYVPCLLSAAAWARGTVPLACSSECTALSVLSRHSGFASLDPSA